MANTITTTLSYSTRNLSSNLFSTSYPGSDRYNAVELVNAIKEKADTANANAAVMVYIFVGPDSNNKVWAYLSN